MPSVADTRVVVKTSAEPSIAGDHKVQNPRFNILMLCFHHNVPCEDYFSWSSCVRQPGSSSEDMLRDRALSPLIAATLHASNSSLCRPLYFVLLCGGVAEATVAD